LFFNFDDIHGGMMEKVIGLAVVIGFFFGLFVFALMCNQYVFKQRLKYYLIQAGCFAVLLSIPFILHMVIQNYSVICLSTLIMLIIQAITIELIDFLDISKIGSQ
jgi:hypothetical protein